MEKEYPSYYRQEFGRVARFYDWTIKLWFLPFGGEKRFRSRIVDLLEIKEGENLLEICCGTATLSLMAARKGAEVTGIDLSPEMIEVARRKAEANNLKTQFLVANVEKIPLKSGSFNRLVVSLGLHEMPKAAVENALKEIYRLLKVGGIGVIVDLARPNSLVMKIIAGIFLRLVETETARNFVGYDLKHWLKDLNLELEERISRGWGMAQILKFRKIS